MSDITPQNLCSYLRNSYPEKPNLTVADLTCVNEGWESDVYTFTLEYGAAGERPREGRQVEHLVLRLYPGSDAYEKSGDEARGMQTLYKAGYPVPRVYLLERDHSPFGKPFIIMEKIDGVLPWDPLFYGSAESQGKLLTLFCSLQVQLHQLDWKRYVDNPAQYDNGDPYSFIDRGFVEFEWITGQYPIPGFEPMMQWLKERRDLVPCPHSSLIHWDFHPNNIILRPDGSAVVIDWTQVQVSDYRFDLAWTLLLCGTHEDAAWRQRILDEYERLAGARVEHLEFFDVVACAKRLYSVAISLKYGPEKLGMRPGAESQMQEQFPALRRVYALLVERCGIRVPEMDELFS